jgi:plasmid stabilization system protein ParE
MEKIVGVVFLDSAETELLDAITWYNEENAGLGFEFAAEIAHTIERIVDNPSAWAPLSPRTRRCRTNRFPYSVIYQIRSETILIVSVMHMKRHPESWRNNLH